MKQESYLLDTNSFISAWQLYYRQSYAPAFWRHLASLIQKGTVVIIDPVYQEVIAGNDELTTYLNNYESLVKKPDERVLSAYSEVMQTVQNNIGTYYDEAALKTWAASTVADPWLIATAQADSAVIVTQEERAINNIKSAGRKNRAVNLMKKAKIPDIADMMNVTCCNLYDFVELNGFRWEKNGNS